MKKKKQQPEEIAPCYALLAFALSVISSSQRSSFSNPVGVVGLDSMPST
jgi:hypothetical protein